VSAAELRALPWRLWLTQMAAVLRLELGKNFLSRRAWWVYPLAFSPVVLTGGHSLFMWHRGEWGHGIGEDSRIFAGIFHFAYLRMGIYFGCAVLFTNLFRGEILQKTLHYYLLAPVRREILAIGKYLSGLAAAIVLFAGSASLAYVTMLAHFGPQFREFLLAGAGLSELGWYALAATLACVSYGAVFLVVGLLFRNPMIPVAVVMVWEGINTFLPPLLKKASVIFYLKSLCPVEVPPSGGLAFLALDADPPATWLAVAGLLLLAVLMLIYAGLRARKLEVTYSE
jgi:hypothetical protein